MWGEEYIQDYLRLDIIQYPRFSPPINGFTTRTFRGRPSPDNPQGPALGIEMLSIPLSGMIVRLIVPVGLEQRYEAVCLQCRDRSRPYLRRRERALFKWAEEHFCKMPTERKWVRSKG